MNEIFNQLGVESGLLFQRDKLSYEELKFAQLIVRECAQVILETPVEYTEMDTMHRIRDSVKEHFGVENND